jgi:hypothetical protein
LRIVSRTATGPGGELAAFDEVFLHCDPSWQQLLRGTPRIERFEISRPRLRLVCNPQGKWNLEQLLSLPLPQQQGVTPGTVDGAVIEVVDEQKSPPSVYTLRDVHLVVARDSRSHPAQGAIRLQGRLLGDYLRQAELTGQLLPRQKTWNLSCTLRGLDASPEFHAALPAWVCQQCEPLRALRAKVDAKVDVSHDAALAQPLQFSVTAAVSQGRIADPRLPYPWSDISATVRCHPRELVIDNLVARDRQSSIRLSARRAGLGPAAPLFLQIQGRRLVLDRQLFAALPEQYRSIWDKFAPLGEIDVEGTVTFDGRTWHPDLTARCLNLSFQYHKYPYRLERTTGTLRLKNNLLTFDLTSYARTDPLRITGQITNPGPQFTGVIEVRGPNVRLDEDLVAALPEKNRAFVRSLNPSGSFGALLRLWRDDPRQEVQRYFHLTIHRGAIKYEKFRYPLNLSRGTLELRSDAWTFYDLAASNDTGQVVGEGFFSPPDQQDLFFLKLAATHVPLSGDLHDALPPRMQRLWQSLQPRGAVDLPQVEIRYHSKSRQLGLLVEVQPRGDTASIEPREFRYRLEKLQGTIRFQDGHADLYDIRAEHGRVAIATGGYCDISPDGAWHLHLQNLIVDRLAIDRDVLHAVPEGLRQALQELQPAGAINVQGQADLRHSGAAGDHLRADWDLALYLHANRLQPGVELNNLYGEVRLAGTSYAGQLQSRGELALDSVCYGPWQFTDVRGPLWIDNQGVRLGAPTAERIDPLRHPHLSAHCYGGTIYGDAWVARGAPTRYSLRATLEAADLAKLSQEAFPGPQDFSGMVNGQLYLRGAGGGVRDLVGHGNLQLREADIYQLPLLVGLLKVLSLKPPDSRAFSSSDVDFTIQADHVYLGRIDFRGDAVSLLGKGEIDFEKQIHMTFHAMVGRGESKLPLVKEVLGFSSQQILQLHVDGTLDKPNVRSEPFPGVNQVLQQLNELGSPPPQGPQTRIKPAGGLLR